MDNPGAAHRGHTRIRELIEARRAELVVFVPSYSPGSKPDRASVLSKIKTILRKLLGAHTHEALLEAMWRRRSLSISSLQ